MDESPVVLYLHVPKSGGTTLNERIFSHCRHPEYYRDELYEGTYYFHSGVYYFPIGFFKPTDLMLPSRVARVLQRSDLRAVVGHFWFGIHRFLRQRWTYVTVLRDPVERVISLFYHLKRESSPSHFLADISLEEFVEMAPYREVDNDQTRRISGFNPDVGELDVKALKLAKQNLREHFSVVGTTDRFDHTLLLMQRRLGWTGSLGYYPKNQNPARPALSDISQPAINAVIQRNQLDIALYDYANQLLDQAIAAQDADFRDALVRLQGEQRGRLGHVWSDDSE